VATPGRLLELQSRLAVNFEDVEMLVLDEADRMIGLGFTPDLRRILKLLPETRQTLLFSATMPPELNRVAKERWSSRSASTLACLRSRRPGSSRRYIRCQPISSRICSRKFSRAARHAA
jgi:ATP-dependent RNA helicase RhlE